MENKRKTVASNKKAYHDYFVLETYEAGIELCGTEVKSLRAGQCNMKDSFCKTDGHEIFIEGMHISPYEKGNIFNREPYRTRKLLMHKKEILKLFNQVARQGLTLVPLSMYFDGKWVKVELGMCKGKKLYDKREDDAKKTAKREMERAESGRS